jgi:glucose-6-phosphate 1-epimerase
MQPAVEPVEFRGLPALRLASPDGAQALVTLHGAQLLSWIPAGGDERLYLSERAAFEHGKAIRGGVPVIFPQFSGFGPLPRHGFARIAAWDFSEQRAGADFACATLRLTDSAESRAQWPHAFALELTVCVGDNRLDVELEAENPGDTAYSFTCALHTYLRVAEIETARLFGLRGVHYRDQAQSGAERVDTQEALEVGAPVDRIYHAPPGELMLREPDRSTSVSSTNFPDVVVWNPWTDSSPAIADLPPTGFRRFLCVEAAAVAQPLVLKPGEQWWGRQALIALR